MQTTSQQIQHTLSTIIHSKTKAPLPVKIICILGFIGSALAALGIIMNLSSLAGVGSFFLIYYAIAVAAGFLSLVWLWQMKKNGASLYAGLFAGSQVVMLMYGVWTLNLTFFIGLAVTAIALYYGKNME